VVGDHHQIVMHQITQGGLGQCGAQDYAKQIQLRHFDHTARLEIPVIENNQPLDGIRNPHLAGGEQHHQKAAHHAGCL